MHFKMLYYLLEEKKKKKIDLVKHMHILLNLNLFPIFPYFSFPSIFPPFSFPQACQALNGA